MRLRLIECVFSCRWLLVWAVGHAVDELMSEYSLVCRRVEFKLQPFWKDVNVISLSFMFCGRLNLLKILTEKVWLPKSPAHKKLFCDFIFSTMPCRILWCRAINRSATLLLVLN